jgi:hypothetical protein
MAPARKSGDKFTAIHNLVLDLVSFVDGSVSAFSVLNLREIPTTHIEGGSGNREVLMTKHRTITGFVAVAVLAVAATAVTVRSHSPRIDGIKNALTDPNKAEAADFDARWSAISAIPQTSR